MATVGERIKARRTELKLSQNELAHHLGYKSSTSIARIESGKRELPQKKIQRVAEVLYTTPEYIMGWNEEQKKDKIPPKNDAKVSEGSGIILELDTSRLIEAIHKALESLNEPARKKVLNYVEDLQENKKNLRSFVEKIQKHKKY